MNDPRYTRAQKDLDHTRKILVALYEEKNMLMSQGELLGPCCGTLAGCRSHDHYARM